MTLELDEAGVAHGLSVVGRVLKWEDYYQGVKIEKKAIMPNVRKNFIHTLMWMFRSVSIKAAGVRQNPILTT